MAVHSGFATWCGTCDCATYVVMPDQGNVGVPFEYEKDRFTVSPIRHICWPRDQRIGRLIKARRELTEQRAQAVA